LKGLYDFQEKFNTTKVNKKIYEIVNMKLTDDDEEDDDDCWLKKKERTFPY